MTDTSTEPTADPPLIHQPDDEVILLPGWPGYRTQPGRSGLDYIDTQLELAHMAGIFLRQFFSGRWLHPGAGPHPLITLMVGIALLIAFPGTAGVCLAVPVVLLIGLIAAIQNRTISQDQDESEEVMETSEAEDGWSDDNGLEEDGGESSEIKDG